MFFKRTTSILQTADDLRVILVSNSTSETTQINVILTLTESFLVFKQSLTASVRDTISGNLQNMGPLNMTTLY